MSERTGGQGENRARRERCPRIETDISTFEGSAPNSQGRLKCSRGEELRTWNSSGSALLEVPSALPGDHSPYRW